MGCPRIGYYYTEAFPCPNLRQMVWTFNVNDDHTSIGSLLYYYTVAKQVFLGNSPSTITSRDMICWFSSNKSVAFISVYLCIYILSLLKFMVFQWSHKLWPSFSGRFGGIEVSQGEDGLHVWRWPATRGAGDLSSERLGEEARQMARRFGRFQWRAFDNGTEMDWIPG